MAAPTVRLYAAHSAHGTDHSKIKLTCVFCPFWQTIVDNIKLLPIPQTIPLDSRFVLQIENTTLLPKMIYSTDIKPAGAGTPPIWVNKYPICEISAGSSLHIDNIVPVLATTVTHAAHNNVSCVRVRNFVDTNELLDDTGTFEVSFKMLEGILPADFIAATFANIDHVLLGVREYIVASGMGIVRCSAAGDTAQYVVKFVAPLMVVQYIVRVMQDRGIAVGTTMNPDDVCVTAYISDICERLIEGCDTARSNMRAIGNAIAAQL